MRALLRWSIRLVLALVALALLIAAIGFGLLRGSLPRLDGSLALPGLRAEVRVARDSLGVPEIEASDRVDASRALGFLHAQDRFFQMDLLRRRGSGELAALIGPALIDHDRDVRRHQLREAARETVRRLSAEQRAILDAYVEGVNAGLSALRVRPPEYLLLRTRPEPWQPEDSLLVGYAMYFTLQDPNASEEQLPLGAVDSLPADALRFFRPDGSDWDAALDDTRVPGAPMPGPDVVDFRGQPGENPRAASPSPSSSEPPPICGSNSWGVDGASTTTGAAMVANDMHLDLGLPNVWYRACLKWRDGDGTPRRMVGATLPGVPSFIVGSNGRIAWGFTNATLDSTDLVLLELDPADPDRYRTPEGWKTIETVTCTLEVRGEPSKQTTFRRTVWGPVLRYEGSPHTYAVRWLAHAPDAVNLGLLEMESARNVDEALDRAPHCRVPMQNFLVGDAAGKLAWTLIGVLPQRVGLDGTSPRSWSDGRCYWTNDPAGERRPRRVADAGQRLWTANNRILGSPDYLALGAFRTDPGARAHQIRDDLLALPPKTDESGLLSIHRDDRAKLLERWQELLMEVLRRPVSDPRAAKWAEARRAVENWGGRAAVDSVGYRLVRAFRFQVLGRVYEPVLERARRGMHGFDHLGERAEAPFWQLATAKPRHLLNPKFADYEALYEDAFDAVLADLESRKIDLASATWGTRNLSRIRHPISRAVPQLSRFLDLPSIPLPGDDRMPRVQGPAFGASERMVVSPGHEETGIFHMPGGQSGHFLSPYYAAGHEAWVRVEPTPLLPGPARHALTLRPAPRG